MKWSLGLPLTNRDTSAPSLSLQSISGVPNVPGSELTSRLPNVVELYGRLCGRRAADGPQMWDTLLVHSELSWPSAQCDHPLIILSAVQMGRELTLCGERQQVGGRREDLALLIILSSLSLIKNTRWQRQPLFLWVVEAELFIPPSFSILKIFLRPLSGRGSLGPICGWDCHLFWPRLSRMRTVGRS